jgi:hypothetical protein
MTPSTGAETLPYVGRDGVDQVRPPLRFSSPLLNDENLRQGALSNSKALIGRVIAGLKPLAFTEGVDPEVEREAASLAISAGLAVHHDRWMGGSRPYWFTSAAMMGQIDDVFDLDALLADYRELYEPWPDAVKAVKQELKKLRRSQISDYLSFSDLEVDLPAIMDGRVHPAGEYARTGLLLGYPVLSTVEVAKSSMSRWLNSSTTRPPA